MDIVAEFTYNHRGDILLAQNMIAAASRAGATAVKFEMRNNARYYRNNPQMLSKRSGYEFSDEQIDAFSQTCKQNGINWFASVHDLHSARRLMRFDPLYLKIASREARCFDFLKAVKETNAGRFPIIVSTGGLSFDEIQKIYELLAEEELILLHTVCNYPCAEDDLNINRIRLMKEKFSCRVGYSGHEEGYLPSLYAAACGADYIERHFRLDENSETTIGKENFRDDRCTLTETEFAAMSRQIRGMHTLSGQPAKLDVNPEELIRVNAYGRPEWDGTDVFLSPEN